ncbi:MAG TPA: ABC transporter substrate-binding protein [Chloroflexota bacterium]
MNRREVVRMLALGAGLSVAAGCAPIAPAAISPTASSARPTVSAPTESAQPRTGGTLRFAQNVEIAAGGAAGTSPLDGQNISPAPLSAIWLGYDSLIRYDDALKPQPMLAESWDLSSDYTRIKFNLRKGVQFHTGREFTSDDVKYNLLRVRQPNVGAQFTNMSKWWTSIETPDKYTVVLTSDQPRPAMFDLFEMMNMVDKDVTENPDLLIKTSGATGPFKFAEYIQGQHIRWVKNPGYWQSGKPYLDEVMINFVGDAQSMVVQFESGTLDAIDAPPSRDALRLKQDGRYRVLVNDASGQYWVLVLNTTAGPTQNQMVRQALNYAIDRKRFIDTALGGVGDPEDLPWLPNTPAYDEAKRTRYAFDPDRARALIAQSGVADVTFDFVFNGVVPEIASFAQIFQASLANIGVTLNIKPVERAVYNDLAAKFQYGVLMSSSGFANFDPATLPLLSRYWDPNNNLAGMNDNAEYRQLVNAVSTEADATKRKAVLSQLNDVILDQSFSIPVATAKHVTVVRSNVNGFRWRASEAVDYSAIWLGA